MTPKKGHTTTSFTQGIKMKHLEHDLKTIKSNILDMWGLVSSQLDNTRTALLEFDKSLANEVSMKEKRVDAFELKIDEACETFLALQNPFAADLRFVLATLKINYNLERIGDFANAISLVIEDLKEPVDEDIISKLKITEMFHICLLMMKDAASAFINEDSKLARGIFKMDKDLNAINKKAPDVVVELIKQKPEKTRVLIDILSVVRRLERVGDHMTNVAEEIIFSLEAKKLSHAKFKNKIN